MIRGNSKKTVLVLTFLAAAVLLMSCTSQSGAVNGTSLAETSSETENANTADPTGQGGEDHEDAVQPGGVPISVYNDTVELGTLAVFTPSEDIEGNSGVAIAGSAEEQLQQERIAGGAVGGVVSENLEPLKGITDYSEGEYVPVYGVTVD